MLASTQLTTLFATKYAPAPPHYRGSAQRVRYTSRATHWAGPSYSSSHTPAEPTLPLQVGQSVSRHDDRCLADGLAAWMAGLEADGCVERVLRRESEPTHGNKLFGDPPSVGQPIQAVSQWLSIESRSWSMDQTISSNPSRPHLTANSFPTHDSDAILPCIVSQPVSNEEPRLAEWKVCCFNRPE